MDLDSSRSLRLFVWGLGVVAGERVSSRPMASASSWAGLGVGLGVEGASAWVWGRLEGLVGVRPRLRVRLWARLACLSARLFTFVGEFL